MAPGSTQEWLHAIAAKEGRPPAEAGTADALAAFRREDARLLQGFLAARARGEAGQAEAEVLSAFSDAHVAAISQWAGPDPAPALLVSQARDGAELAAARSRG